MEVILAECVGFCSGVKRAIQMALDIAEENKGRKIYTLGDIIHNPPEIERLREQGIEKVEDISLAKDGILMIRSHGAPPEVIEEAHRQGIEVIDTTCSKVRTAQNLAASLKREGYKVVIVGDKAHQEVIGILGYVGGEAIVIQNEEEARQLPRMKRVGVIAQTTQSHDDFERIRKILTEKAGDIKVYNTICYETVKRQDTARELAGQVDIMIVVGGHNSANTKRLAEACRRAGVETYHIEDPSELEEKWFIGKKKVGMTTGTSTPDWMITKVREAIEHIPGRNRIEVCQPSLPQG